MLVEAAGSVGRMKGRNYLAAQHARLTARPPGRAELYVQRARQPNAYAAGGHSVAITAAC